MSSCMASISDYSRATRTKLRRFPSYYEILDLNFPIDGVIRIDDIHTMDNVQFQVFFDVTKREWEGAWISKMVVSWDGPSGIWKAGYDHTEAPVIFTKEQGSKTTVASRCILSNEGTGNYYIQVELWYTFDGEEHSFFVPYLGHRWLVTGIYEILVDAWVHIAFEVTVHLRLHGLFCK